MERIVYILIFAVIFLIFKAFFLDDYIAENYQSETNSSVDVNMSAEATTVSSEPEQENNISGMSAEKKSVPEVAEDKKMPLDQLGDSLTKHLKL